VRVCTDDFVDDFLDFAGAAASRPRLEQTNLWRRLYEERHRKFFSVYLGEYGDPNSFDEALDRLLCDAAAIERRRPRAVGLVQRTSRRLAEVLAVDISELRFVLFVGLYDANAWVADFDGAPTAFFALELLPDAPGDELLVAHETTHQLHRRLSPETWDDNKLAQLLFQEGVAIAGSEALLPGREEAEYLWFATGHQDWLDACRSCWPVVREELLATVEGRMKHSVERYFRGGGATRYSGDLPERIGYFAARLVVQRILATAPLAEVMTWSADQAAREVSASLARA